jgi:UDP-N-acetylmuramyl tripeptide synthase
MLALPFEDSRRLTGSNLFFDGPGAVLELLDPHPDAGIIRAWRERVERALHRLGWPLDAIVARSHAHGTSLALAAPVDQLFTATEINEWALCATLVAHDSAHWAGTESALRAEDPEADDPAVLDERQAFERLIRLRDAECKPTVRAAVRQAHAVTLQAVVDDETLTLGSGCGARSWPIDAHFAAADVPWAELRDVPTALVTGSNGKTTTVRLLAACARVCGWQPGFCCTDGVFVANQQLMAGDYSGPVGAREVLRNVCVEAALLETARGGILRRGLAMTRADAAIVTNVSADHFGEYGIDDLDALADAKLVVARALAPRGLLVLNADDPTLLAKGEHIEITTGWFALDADSAALRTHRVRGGATCGVRAERLILDFDGSEHDLGAIRQMPLTVMGSARYNVANLAGAALTARALGIDADSIATAFSQFGRHPADNAGRMMRFELGGIEVLMDYAHNPAGLAGVLAVAGHLRGSGRLAVLLGQAGNRTDTDIEQLAAVALDFHPDLIVVKEIDGYARGRAEGDVARILHGSLTHLGADPDALAVRIRELDAARHALSWARPGDVVVLLVHSLPARRAVLALIESLQRSAWRAGDPLAD